MLTESLYPCIMKMVSANVCRALPPPTDDFDPEEDEPVLESSWPHLQVNHSSKGVSGWLSPPHLIFRGQVGRHAHAPGM